MAAARAAEAEQAAAKADQARLAAVAAGREAAQAMTPVRTAENLKLRAEAQLAAAERAAASAIVGRGKGAGRGRQDEGGREGRRTRRAAGRRQSRVATEIRCRGTRPRCRSRGRECARRCGRGGAQNGARTRGRCRSSSAARPSISMSAKAFSPSSTFPSPSRILIAPSARMCSPPPSAPKAITDMRWSVVSLYGSHQDDGMPEPRDATRLGLDEDNEAIPTDLGAAKAALDRIVIPQDTRDRIAEMVSPRSSLIISDEALSRETGQGTDFVVLLSGEPQGGIKNSTARSGVRGPLLASAGFLFLARFVFHLVSLQQDEVRSAHSRESGKSFPGAAVGLRRSPSVCGAARR